VAAPCAATRRGCKALPHSPREKARGQVGVVDGVVAHGGRSGGGGGGGPLAEDGWPRLVPRRGGGARRSRPPRGRRRGGGSAWWTGWSRAAEEGGPRLGAGRVGVVDGMVAHGGRSGWRNISQ